MPSLAILVLAGAELLRVHSPRPLQAESAPEALIPWETPIAGFFIRSHHGVPRLDPGAWTITIDGLVDHPMTLRVADLAKRAPLSFHAVLECSGNGRALHSPRASGVQWQDGAVGNAEWTGPAMAELLAAAGLQKEARFARIVGADSPAFPSVPAFVRSVPLAKLTAPDTILALSMNREPLPLLHGGPVRLVLPNWYGENWIKWVSHITITATEDEGFFMKKAYRIPKQPVKPGEPWDSATGRPIEQLLVQTLITAPATDEVIAPGTITVKGKAFSGAGAITQVDLSTDDGKSWSKATLEPRRPTGGWQEFSGPLPFKTSGKAAIIARATDAAGAVQPLEVAWNPGGYVRNAADRVEFMVSPGAQPLASTILAEKCETCHARELIDAQRQPRAAWEKTLTKMEGFGLKLTADEKTSLLAHFAALKADAPDAEPRLGHYERIRDANAVAATKVRSAVNSSRTVAATPPPDAGAETFASICAPCHGAAGEGAIGPRLQGRAMAPAEFRAAVLYGQRSMPGFAAAISEEDVGALYQYVAAH